MGFRKQQPAAGTAGTATRKRGWFVLSRATFWALWALSTLVSTAFAVLALISFAQMHRVHNTADFSGRRQIRGPMAAEFFGAVAVVLTNTLALFALLWKTAKRNATGFGYGYVVASYGISGLWLILSGIVMWAGNDKSLWNTTPHWGHGVSVAYGVAFVLAWVTSGLYLITWTVLFLFRRSFRQPAAVVGDAETGMTAAYPAANTYTSPAYASSPRAAAPGASRGWFARKPTAAAAPLTAGAATAAATANGHAHTDGALSSSTTNAAAGPLENVTHSHGRTSAPGQYGAFTQHNGAQRSNSGLSEEQSMQAVPAASAPGGSQGNLVYAREAEMDPVGPSGVSAAAANGPGQVDQSHNVMYNDNKAGFFQSA